MLFYCLYNGSMYVQITVVNFLSHREFLQWLDNVGDNYMELPISCIVRVMGRRALTAGGAVRDDHWPMKWPGKGPSRQRRDRY